MKIARKYLPPIALLLVSTIGVAYAATTLFTQTFPSIAASTAITSHCSSLTPNVSSVVTGGSGVVAFDCSGTSTFGTTPAFTITQSAALTMTPTFALAAVYTSLFVYSINNGVCGSPAVLASGTSVTLGGTTGYSYCANYSNAPSTGLPTFTITWSQ